MNKEFDYQNLIKRIEIDPERLSGKPVIKGTRIAVEQILRMLGASLDTEEILIDFPHLKREDILAALVYTSIALDKNNVTRRDSASPYPA